MKHRINIVQTFRLKRQIIVEIEARDADHACDLADDGRIDVPAYDDPRWAETRTLEREESSPA